jgi:hypothetical protein
MLRPGRAAAFAGCPLPPVGRPPMSGGRRGLGTRLREPRGRRRDGTRASPHACGSPRVRGLAEGPRGGAPRPAGPPAPARRSLPRAAGAGAGGRGAGRAGATRNRPVASRIGRLVCAGGREPAAARAPAGTSVRVFAAQEPATRAMHASHAPNPPRRAYAIPAFWHQGAGGALPSPSGRPPGVSRVRPAGPRRPPAPMLVAGC